jgi:hypothetical protein
VDNLGLETIFNEGTEGEVHVPVFREQGGSYVRIRSPRPEELHHVMQSNVELAKWTQESLFTGKFSVMNVSVHETFHAMMPRLGDRTLDNMMVLLKQPRQ